MSKITHDVLTRFGTGTECFIAVPRPYSNCGRQRVKRLSPFLNFCSSDCETDPRTQDG